MSADHPTGNQDPAINYYFQFPSLLEGDLGNYFNNMEGTDENIFPQEYDYGIFYVIFMSMNDLTVFVDKSNL